ncbi:hypothetical protein EWM64_g7778 [Hericium alpestre]|uniref:Transmembrane protein 135 N-terminal domain-containing protein n=1 Tax=Hericium alpestre TaxID=135208 RepID=A0A4Y9ZPP3_9AGAM|nr:hypothetical protein EWM64_g7778 [Hericium alpestre]
MNPDPPPLGRKPSYLPLAPQRAIASFENLVVLANYEEHLREARKMVWRNRGEPAVEIHDLWECVEHGTRGGARAAAIAFAIRSGVNLVLSSVRLKGASSNDSAVSDSESSSSEITPIRSEISPTARRNARLSTTAQVHQVWVRKKTRRWHAIVAGSVAGGLAILFEKKSRRTTIAQQLFVRGLQGSYNAFSVKHGFHIPHGDVIVFSLMCGQILYGFLLRPDTLPRSYVTWINKAGKIPVEGVNMNRDLVRTGQFKLSDVANLLERDDIAPGNATELLMHQALASAPQPIWPSRYGPCAAVHPAEDSCLAVPPLRFLSVFKWMVPVYGALHLIPMLLFKRKDFAKEPARMLLRALLGTSRSSAFLATFVVIYQSFFCFKLYLYKLLKALRESSSFVKPPQWLINFLISKPSFWMGGLLSGLSLFVEAKRRRGELAMYVLPKGLESAWIMARGKGLVFRTGEFGEAMLTAIGMGMVMSTYQNDPQHLSGFIRRILYQFIGPN